MFYFLIILLLGGWLGMVTAQPAARLMISEVDGIYYPSNLKIILPDSLTTKDRGVVIEQSNFDSLTVVIPPFMVNSLEGELGAQQWDPDIAMDSSGQMAVAWVDRRTGFNENYIQFYDSDARPLGKNKRFSDQPSDWNPEPSIARNKEGHTVVVWAKDAFTISGQLFDAQGNRLGNNFTVNSVRDINTMEPSVAINDSGYFVAVWSQSIFFDRDNLLARVFKPDGTPVSEDIIVSDSMNAGPSSFGWKELVATDGSDTFVVVWSEYRDGRSRIFLQRLNTRGEKIGKNILVSDSASTKNHYFPAISAMRDGHFLICYTDGNIYARVFHREGYFTSDPIVLLDDPTGYIFPMSIAVGTESFIVSVSGWRGIIFGEINKYGQITRPFGPPTNTAGDTLDLPLYTSSMTNYLNGKFYFAYQQYIRNDTELFLMPINRQLQAIAEPTRINQDPGSAWQVDPRMFTAPNGYVLLLWKDYRHGRGDLYGQLFDENLNPIGENIKINDAEGDHWFTRNYSAVGLKDGTFIIAFTGSENYSDNGVYLQKVDANGEKAGENREVHYFYYQYIDVKLGYSPDNSEVLLVWYNDEPRLDFAYMKLFNENLQGISGYRNFIKYRSDVKRQPFSFQITPELDVYFTFSQFLPDSQKFEEPFYALRFNKYGQLNSDSLILDNTNGDRYYVTAWFNDSLEYCLVWLDNSEMVIKRVFYKNGKKYDWKNKFNFSTDYNPYRPPEIVRFSHRKSLISYSKNENTYLIYFNDNARQQNHYHIHKFWKPDRAPGMQVRVGNSMAVANGLLLFAYTSVQNDTTGYDIWLKGYATDVIDFQPEPFYDIGEKDFLFPNFPNPFTSKTTIAFRISAYHHVRLELFDVLGRRVATLVDEPRERGLYKIVFDGSQLPSGIYFCRLTAYDTQTRKILLLK